MAAGCSIAVLVAWLSALLPAPTGPVTDALDTELSRLRGQQVTITGAGYTIDDIAGEGRPLVGVVERRGDHLILVAGAAGEYRLAGPLARPRIAGPGYKVWALGTLSGRPPQPVLTVRRIGVLAPPSARSARQRAASVMP
ncbi:MAG: hypothetical protein AAGC55_13010 [Myxococcota bacterium]